VAENNGISHRGEIVVASCQPTAIRRTSSRPGRTIREVPLTKSWLPAGDREKQPPANVAGAHGWRFNRDSARNGETRNCRKHGQLQGCGRREALTEGPGEVLKWNWLPFVDAFRTLVVCPPPGARAASFQIQTLLPPWSCHGFREKTVVRTEGGQRESMREIGSGRLAPCV